MSKSKYEIDARKEGAQDELSKRGSAMRRLMGRWLAVGMVLSLVVWFGGCLETESTHPSGASALSPVGKQTLAIIGGQPDTQLPGVGALAVSGRTFCTGTLIASRVVLTAAHCIDSAQSSGGRGLQFRIDVPNPQNPKGFDEKYYEIEYNLLSSHPQWDQQVSRGYDVGVAILKQKVPDTVAKVIPFNATPLTGSWVGKELLFLGYGYIQSVPNAVTPNRKYGAKIPVVSLTNDRIEHQAQGKSVCHGDSGGPALFTINGQLRVIGVNSYVTAARVQGANPPRSACNASGVSMRTDTYRQYINSILLKHGDGPAACKDNQDCGSCSVCGAKNVCEPKSFPLEATSCRPCKQDSDCGSGVCHRFETGFRCIQPCTKEGCCPDSTVCTPLSGSQSGWACIPKAGKCEDFPCKADTECGPGESCQGSVCQPKLPPRSPKLCHPCQSVYDCDSPKHLCYGPKGNTQCLMPCGEGEFCPAGFSCRELYAGAPKQCVPTDNNCSVPCQLDSHCPTGQVCQKGFCGRAGGGKYGDLCSDSSPCAKDLSCVDTLGGKRCLSACGVDAGNAGSFCDGNNQCSDGSNCYALGGGFRVCLNRCNSDADCGSSGGGRCYQGICYCQGASDCGQGFACNTTTGYLGACAKAGLSKPCADKQECRTFASGAFCVPEGNGVRGIGESCDSLNRCRDGLICLGADTGAVCFEDCTQTGQCQLGGTCAQYGRTLRVCLCTGANCPKGRSCKPVVQGQYGFCQADTQTSGCVSDKDCPPAHTCQKAACVADPVEPKEPSSPEPPVVDGGGTDAPAVVEPKPEPVKPEPVVVDAGPTTTEKQPVDTGTTSGPEVAGPGGGCGCSTTNPVRSPLWGLFLLLVLVPFRIRRRY